ncbi:Thiamine-phosphate synthase [Planctomycetes bacterium Pan216]|uniref:Thiamine-phosphate synthase n=2 Tax=Kolteria novifilia TaxID=2527975 RepID=A0A518AYS0_9BACT|nr:Thiamine-phosphate synthase [Planctomycetes bacterium Pan216]
MMWHEHYSAAARRALDAARCLPPLSGRDSVDPLSLLAALLRDDESEAIALLRRANIHVLHFINDLPSLDELDESSNPPPQVTYDSETAHVMRLAAEMVPADASQTIGSQELLLALLAGSSTVAKFLGDHDVDAEQILAMNRQPATIAVDPEDQQLDLQVEEVTEHHDVARIIDANANRAREGMRVVEDYVRFARNDAALSLRLKEARHRFQEAFAYLPTTDLLASRDTTGDVGTRLTTRAEASRASVRDVVQANLKRSQEAVRTLEEYAKTISAVAGRIFESVRYELYTLERLLLIQSEAAGRIAGASLYWLADPDACSRTLDWMVERAVAGGVQVVQLRDKRSEDRELLRLAQLVRRITAQAGAMFIMNDRPDIARLVDADGVHVGQEELPVAQVRRIVGTEMLVGVSTHSLEQARQAVLDGADYIGIGPVFPSRTKQFDAFAGIPSVKQVASEISLPAFAIGGIGPGNLPQVMDAGATRIAVGHVLCVCDDPASMARQLRHKLDSTSH